MSKLAQFNNDAIQNTSSVKGGGCGSSYSSASSSASASSCGSAYASASASASVGGNCGSSPVAPSPVGSYPPAPKPTCTPAPSFCLPKISINFGGCR